jgi:hypothetical protein
METLSFAGRPGYTWPSCTMCANASRCVDMVWWLVTVMTSACANAGLPVYTMTCWTGDTSAVWGAKGPLNTGAGWMGTANDTARPVRTSRAARARTSSVIRFNVPNSSSSPQRPQLPGSSSVSLTAAKVPRGAVVRAGFPGCGLVLADSGTQLPGSALCANEPNSDTAAVLDQASRVRMAATACSACSGVRRPRPHDVAMSTVVPSACSTNVRAASWAVLSWSSCAIPATHSQFFQRVFPQTQRDVRGGQPGSTRPGSTHPTVGRIKGTAQQGKAAVLRQFAVSDSGRR